MKKKTSSKRKNNQINSSIKYKEIERIRLKLEKSELEIKRLEEDKNEFKNKFENKLAISVNEEKVNKIELAEKLIKAYEKEENLLAHILRENKKYTGESEKIYNEIIQLKREKIELANKLYNSYLKEEALLNTYQKLKNKYNGLEKKYNSLKNSKLGKLTIWYWRLKRGGRQNG